MKKFNCCKKMCLVLCFPLIACGCDVWNEKPEPTSLPIGLTDSNIVIWNSTSAEKMDFPGELTENIEFFESPFENGLSTEQCEESVLEENVIIGESVFEHKKTFQRALLKSQDQSVATLGYYSVYFNAQSATEITYQKNKDILLEITNQNNQFCREQQISQEEAVEIAKKFVKEQYGEDVLNNYKIVLIDDETHLVNQKRYNILFECSIGEYSTNGMISIIVNANGQVYKMSANNIDIYKNIISLLSKNAVEEAEDRMLNMLDSQCDIDRKFIAIDAEGVCYLAFWISTDTGEGVAYISIE